MRHRYSQLSQHQHGDWPDAGVERIHDRGFDILQREKVHDPCHCGSCVEGNKQLRLVDEGTYLLQVVVPCPGSKNRRPKAKLATMKKLMDWKTFPKNVS